MKVKMTIKMKMLVYILTTSFVIYVFALGYVSFKLNSIAFKDAKKLTKAYSNEFANYTKADINVDMDMARALAQASIIYDDLSPNQINTVLNEMLERLIEKNPNFLSVWFNMELSAIQPDWHKSHGRLRLTYYRNGTQIMNSGELVDTAEGFSRGAYYDILEEQREYVMEPYYFTYEGTEEEVLETSLAFPIIVDGVSVGVAGIDLTLDRFQDIIDNIKPVEGSYAFLVAHNGQIVAHKNNELVGQFIQDLEEDELEIFQNIQKGKELFFDKKDENGDNFWVAYSPVYIGSSNTPWSFGLAIPVDVIMAKEKAGIWKSLVAGFLGLILTSVIIWLIAHNISLPIVKTTSILGGLAQGDIDEKKKVDVKQKDEIGEMGNSVNSLIDGLNKTAKFAKEIGKGNLEKEFELLSDKDVLGNSLLEMRKSLKHAKQQEEARNLEDEKQNWATQGLAKFGDILRQNADDMSEFSYHIISNLVKYIDANQGGIFMLNDDDKSDVFIELLAFHAYSRRKFMEKRIELGVGLIGRCVQEQKTLHMTNLPEEYIKVTSGLGQAVPNTLLIVPLKVNDEIFGVLELAGFNPFEDHVVNFIEEVGESIASTISTTKINIRTNFLLEQSQQQSEEMSAQEEEMRQNMEELQATQEEAGRRSFEMQGLLDALNTANLVIEYDLNGHIIQINDNYLKLVGTTRSKMIGTHHTENMQLTNAQKKDNDNFWADLRNGKSKKETDHIEFGGKNYVFVATYTPILDQDDKPVKILKIATDITSISKN